MFHLYPLGDHVWVDERTGKEFNVEIGARVVATQAGQIVLIDDNEKVNFILSVNVLITFSSLGITFSYPN